MRGTGGGASPPRGWVALYCIVSWYCGILVIVVVPAVHIIVMIVIIEINLNGSWLLGATPGRKVKLKRQLLNDDYHLPWHHSDYIHFIPHHTTPPHDLYPV